jgi:LmbE family N-acetylglucosaminyl deacetylase
VPLAQKITEGREAHILLLSRGTHSAVLQHINGARWSSWCRTWHNPAAEVYAPLDADAFGRARRDELVAALGHLGGGQLHEAGLIDGQITVADAKEAISALVAKVGPNPGVYAPSWLVDDKPDHRAAGQALRELAAEQPTVYADRRWYVLPPYWSDPRLKQVESFWMYANDTDISNRARRACGAYAVWNPPHSYAVGYHSVDYMFAAIDTNPRSLLHK